MHHHEHDEAAQDTKHQSATPASRRLTSRRVATLALATTLTGASLWGALWAAHAGGAALAQAVGTERVSGTLAVPASVVSDLKGEIDYNLLAANHQISNTLTALLPGEWGSHSTAGAPVCGCPLCCGLLDEVGDPGENPNPPGSGDYEFAPVEESLANAAGGVTARG